MDEQIADRPQIDMRKSIVVRTWIVVCFLSELSVLVKVYSGISLAKTT